MAPRGAQGARLRSLQGRYFTGAAVNVSRQYDVSADGQRFLMIKEADSEVTAAAPQIIVVQHWVEELKRLVPVN